MRRPDGPVFENSTACVYVETLVRLASAIRRSESTTCLTSRSIVSGEVDFEHKLKVKRPVSFGWPNFFTESLILAQDERWRRA